jgi:oxygen-dependent protoporphyrinogen oxidase
LKVLVLGGGIAGLAAARFAVESGAEAQVLEATGRAGGVISTEAVEGCLVEAGPDCFLTSKPEGVELCEGLGVALEGTMTEHRRSFIARGKRLVPVPEGFYLMAPDSLKALRRSSLLSWRGRARMAADVKIAARKSDADESLATFVRRRLGRECLERLAQPMIAGITTADPEKLSMRAAMPQFVEMERKHGSLIRALAARKQGKGTSGPRYGLFAAPTAGMQALTDGLVRALGSKVNFGNRVKSLRRDGRGWSVTVDGGAVRRADAVICALASRVAAPLLRPLDARLADLLEGIPFASVATVALAFREDDAPLPRAMGFVVPAVEKRSILACSFTSRKFAGRAPAGISLVRAFLGGALRPADAALSDGDLVARTCADLRDLLGVRADPLWWRVHRHPDSMPQYHVGHLERVSEIEARAAALGEFALCGASYGGVGIPDCVAGAHRAADLLSRAR